MTGQVEQAIRRSHCAHADRDAADHQCIGTCTITPQGVELSCKACGGADDLIAPSATLPESKLVRAMLDAVGVDYDAITPERKARAVQIATNWIKEKRGY